MGDVQHALYTQIQRPVLGQNSNIGSGTISGTEGFTFEPARNKEDVSPPGKGR